MQTYTWKLTVSLILSFFVFFLAIFKYLLFIFSFLLFLFIFIIFQVGRGWVGGEREEVGETQPPKLVCGEGNYLSLRPPTQTCLGFVEGVPTNPLKSPPSSPPSSHKNLKTNNLCGVWEDVTTPSPPPSLHSPNLKLVRGLGRVQLPPKTQTPLTPSLLPPPSKPVSAACLQKTLLCEARLGHCLRLEGTEDKGISQVERGLLWQQVARCFVSSVPNFVCTMVAIIITCSFFPLGNQ